MQRGVIIATPVTVWRLRTQSTPLSHAITTAVYLTSPSSERFSIECHPAVIDTILYSEKRSYFRFMYRYILRDLRFIFVCVPKRLYHGNNSLNRWIVTMILVFAEYVLDNINVSRTVLTLMFPGRRVAESTTTARSV